jgi:hypothetical protein
LRTFACGYLFLRTKMVSAKLHLLASAFHAFFPLEVPIYRSSMVKDANTEFLLASMFGTSTPNNSDSTAMEDLRKVLGYSFSSHPHDNMFYMPLTSIVFCQTWTNRTDARPAIMEVSTFVSVWLCMYFLMSYSRTPRHCASGRICTKPRRMRY